MNQQFRVRGSACHLKQWAFHWRPVRCIRRYISFIRATQRWCNSSLQLPLAIYKPKAKTAAPSLYPHSPIPLAFREENVSHQQWLRLRRDASPWRRAATYRRGSRIDDAASHVPSRSTSTTAASVLSPSQHIRRLVVSFEFGLDWTGPEHLEFGFVQYM